MFSPSIDTVASVIVLTISFFWVGVKTPSSASLESKALLVPPCRIEMTVLIFPAR
jgi:hypothetical protein